MWCNNTENYIFKKLASLFPESTSKISTLFFIFRGLEQRPKPTRTQPYCLPAVSFITHRKTEGREQNYIPACPFLNKVLTAPSKALGKLQLLLGKHYLVQPASKSCCRQQMGFHKGDQQLFSTLFRKATFPLRDHRRSPTQKCKSSSAPMARERK